MRLTINDLIMQRSRLQNENGRLERQLRRLVAVEGRFEQLVMREGKDVTKMKHLVKENGDIQREMKVRRAKRGGRAMKKGSKYACAALLPFLNLWLLNN